MVLAVAFALFLVFAFPGYSSPDSAQQLGQARAHHYSDGHPPLMAVIWGLVEHIVKDTAGMLVLQGSLFLAGLFVLLRRHMAQLTAAIAAGVILLLPPVLAPMGVIWKDSQMAGFLMLGIALLPNQHRAWRIVGIVSIAFGIGMRHNALVAAFPMFVFVWPGPANARTVVRLALAGLLWVVVSAVAVETNEHLADDHEHAWHYSVGPADIAGVLANTKTVYSDAELEKLLAGTPLILHKDIQNNARRNYEPSMWWPVMNDGEAHIFNWPTNDTERAAITRAWKELVRAETWPWMHHRLRVFRLMLGLHKTNNAAISAPYFFARDVQHDESPPSAPARLIQRIIEWVATKTPIDRPYCYLIASLLLLPFARRNRDALALLFSGILYELTYLPVTPSVEYRYSHWMICCCLVGAAILIATRAASASARRSGSSSPKARPVENASGARS
ncbi:hypothetical protein BH11MYX1_BH11MYX1_00540 [soil metagenome]